MKKLILIMILLLTTSGTANAITITGSQNIGTINQDGQEIPTTNLRSHTVAIYQVNTTNNIDTFYMGAGITLNDHQVLTVFHNVAGMINKPEGVDSVQIFVQTTAIIGYNAKIIKYDEAHDLALLEVYEAKNMPNDTMEYGEIKGTLTTIGHPAGIKNVMSIGNRGFIKQTDYRIPLNLNVQQGNSGGGVINQDGQLVGLITSRSINLGNVGYMVGVSDIKEFIGR